MKNSLFKNKNPHFSKTVFLLIVLLGFVTACNDSTDKTSTTPKKSSQKLFSALAANDSGIEFENTIPRELNKRYFSYQSLFNGGGVSLGDINNDGLADIYFTANNGENHLYQNLGDLKFKDITASAKVGGTTPSWSTGVTMADVNNDGWLDIYVCQSGFYEDDQRANQLFINNKDNSFTEAAAQYGINDKGHSLHAAFFDYDLDGDLDLYVVNHPSDWSIKRPLAESDMRMIDSDKLFQNNGNGTFSDVSTKAGILPDRYTFGLSVAISDLNQDNYPDIYVANDYFGPDQMYINQKNGTFKEEVKERTKHITFNSMGTDIADFNNDGLTDVFVVDMVAEDNARQKTEMAGMNPDLFWKSVELGYHYQYMYNTIQLNNGNGTFSEVGQLAGISNTDWSWAPLVADLDNDGFKDLFVTNGYTRDFRNKDTKVPVTRNAQGKRTLAISMEEYVDAYPSTKIPNYSFKNNGDFTFSKTQEAWGLNHAGFTNGAAYGDLDNDGDLDLVINNLNEKAIVYENNLDGKHFLSIKLAGDDKNPFGIGTKVTLHIKDDTQFQELYLSRGSQSSVAPVLHFGIGQASLVDKVIVQWPSGLQEIRNQVDPNQTLTFDIKNAKPSTRQPETSTLVTDITKPTRLNFCHQENEFDDFEKELLLPHKNSQFGPHISVGDVNGDNLDDVFVGGASGQAGALFIQNQQGTFSKKTTPWAADKVSEDLKNCFFDADNDGDLDLYVTSGGNEFKADSPALQDRLYLNDGRGNFSKSKGKIPNILSSSSTVVPIDLNQDGYLDLFVGGRMKPGSYPIAAKSYLLMNEKGTFKEKTSDAINNLGMVTDAVAEDIDNDGIKDLQITGEWMSITLLKNDGQSLTDVTPANIKENTGWWSSINAADIDNDGDVDFVVGNLGLNYKYKATADEPFHIYAHDFDKSGNLDIVLGYYNEGTCYPLRGRQCSSEQMPFIKEKFPTYQQFASASLDEVYGEQLNDAIHLQATNFASCLLINDGSGQFQLKKLPNQAQFSCINGAVVKDVNQDGYMDIFVAGNLFTSEVETPRNDAGTGLLMLGDESGAFNPVAVNESGFFAPKDVKDLKLMQISDSPAIVISNNNDCVSVFSLGTGLPIN